MFGFFKKIIKQNRFQENYDYLAINYQKELKLVVARALRDEVGCIVKNRGDIEEVKRHLFIATQQKNEAIAAGPARKENPIWLVAELKCNLCELIIDGDYIQSQSAINAMNILFGWIDFVEKDNARSR
jgi:hypothetical protein